MQLSINWLDKITRINTVLLQRHPAGLIPARFPSLVEEKSVSFSTVDHTDHFVVLNKAVLSITAFFLYFQLILIKKLACESVAIAYVTTKCTATVRIRVRTYRLIRAPWSHVRYRAILRGVVRICYKSIDYWIEYQYTYHTRDYNRIPLLMTQDIYLR